MNTIFDNRAARSGASQMLLPARPWWLLFARNDAHAAELQRVFSEAYDTYRIQLSRARTDADFGMAFADWVNATEFDLLYNQLFPTTPVPVSHFKNHSFPPYQWPMIHQEHIYAATA